MIDLSSFILEMVSGHHTNHNSQPDAFTNVMQGRVLFNGNSLPKLLWNQMKILIVANKDGERTPSDRFDSTRLDLFRIRSGTGHAGERNVTEIATVLSHSRHLREFSRLQFELGLRSFAQSVSCPSLHERIGRRLSNIERFISSGMCLFIWFVSAFDVSSRRSSEINTDRSFYQLNFRPRISTILKIPHPI